MKNPIGIYIDMNGDVNEFFRDTQNKVVRTMNELNLKG